MYLGHENKLITYDCWTASTNASAARSPSLLEAVGYHQLIIYDLGEFGHSFLYLQH